MRHLYFKVVLGLDLNYTGLLSEDVLVAKAERLCKFYAIMSRMMDYRALVVRYGLVRARDILAIFMQSIAEHSFLVAQMAGVFYNEFFEYMADKNIMVEKLESEALHHDDAEALTGDAATEVDKVSGFIKNSAEVHSLALMLEGLLCRSQRTMKAEMYEAKMTYSSKIVKLLDAVELVFFTSQCVSNGVGMLYRGEKDGEFVIDILDERCPVDPRVYREVGEFFEHERVESASFAQVMVHNSLPRLEKLKCPELVLIFKLLCKVAFEFPFKDYSLKTMPMEFSQLA